MKDELFLFKQFSVDQAHCPMKINTDGVLLGAMAHHPSPWQILDIGTGTGVIALMLAQRFPAAQVEAVEIDAQAADTANRNFKNADFVNRPVVHHTSFENFSTTKKYDLIVSNPPFFVNDLKNPDVRKTTARHTNESFFQCLLQKSAAMLNEGGKLWLILPVKQAEKIVADASAHGLVLAERIQVYSDISKPAFRQICCFSNRNEDFTEQDFVIYQSHNTYTEVYRRLLKDFFLIF